MTGFSAASFEGNNMASVLTTTEAELATIIGPEAAAAVYKNMATAVEDVAASTRILKLRVSLCCLMPVKQGEALYEQALREVRAGPSPSRRVLEERLQVLVEQVKRGEIQAP